MTWGIWFRCRFRCPGAPVTPLRLIRGPLAMRLGFPLALTWRRVELAGGKGKARPELGGWEERKGTPDRDFSSLSYSP